MAKASKSSGKKPAKKAAKAAPKKAAKKSASKAAPKKAAKKAAPKKAAPKKAAKKAAIEAMLEVSIPSPERRAEAHGRDGRRRESGRPSVSRCRADRTRTSSPKLRCRSPPIGGGRGRRSRRSAASPRAEKHQSVALTIR